MTPVDLEDPRLQRAIDALDAKCPEDLILLAIAALQLAGVPIDNEPSDPILVEIQRASEFRFRNDTNHGFRIE